MGRLTVRWARVLDCLPSLAARLGLNARIGPCSRLLLHDQFLRAGIGELLDWVAGARLILQHDLLLRLVLLYGAARSYRRLSGLLVTAGVSFHFNYKKHNKPRYEP